MTTYCQSTLPNGLTVISESLDTVESVSIGVYVKAGARHENEHNNGVAHFLEHMAFKGTKRRSAQQIALEIEDVGGYMNAYTSRDHTAYHLKVLQEDVPLAVDILADILANSVFDEKEIERERQVILQELGQTLDTPDDMVFENLQMVSYPDQSMGRSILGTAQSINAIQRQTLVDFINTHYKAQNMVVVACGNLKHDDLVALVEKHFAVFEEKTTPEHEQANLLAGKLVQTKDIEQVHVALSWQGVDNLDDDYYAAHVWNVLVGGGMSSRLFQKIREDMGLAYSVYSYTQSYNDTAVFGVYAATSAQQTPALLSALKQELADACEDLSEEEIKRAKVQITAGMRMAQESTESRMGRMARNMLVHGCDIPLEEALEKVEKVNKEDCLRVAKRMQDQSTLAVSVFGPVDENMVVY